VDGDGDKDVLVGALETRILSWYRNDGSENFDKQIINDSSLYTTCVYGADVNGDQQIDIIKASLYGGLSWYKNLGAGTFSEEQDIPIQVDDISSIYVRDVDGDSYVDILATSFNDDSVVLYENNKDGTFSKETIIYV